MSNIVPFQFDAHEIRVLLDDAGEPWWVAKDVCEVLGLEQVSRALTRLKAHEKGDTRITTPGGMQTVRTVNESGLYRLIFRSDKPEAQQFQTWVFEDLLPQIRKTGKYDSASTPQVKNPANQMLIEAIVRLDAVEQRAIAAEQQATQANANVQRAMETQLFFTIAEYVYVNKLHAQIPASAYKACSDHLRVYCLDHGIPFRKIPVGGKRWDDEYGFHISVYTEALPGWLKRRFAQTHLTVIHPVEKEQ